MTYLGGMGDFTPQQHAFMADCENYILEKFWKKGVEELKGTKRIQNKEWLTLIQELTEVDIGLYVEWVMKGYGDEWFCDDETDWNQAVAAFWDKHDEQIGFVGARSMRSRQYIVDEVNRILCGHTISSNTDEPDEPIFFVLDENGEVDVKGYVSPTPT